MRKCVVLESAACGLWANTRAKGVYEDCEFGGSVLTSVLIGGGADPAVRRCIVRN